MKGSLQIAKFFGIPVQVHWTFTLIFGWMLYLSHSNSWSWQEIAWRTIFLLVLFLCVVLHEFGYALTARRFGVTTHDIILSPIGGVARLDRLPDNPFHEFLVAAAGPLVNIVIALLTLPFLVTQFNLLHAINSLADPGSNTFFFNEGLPGLVLLSLFLLNITLALFNLLPAFPMDGGRILRALLSLRLGRKRATQVAAFIGQSVAVLFILFGFWEGFNLMTALIGVFVFITATSEKRSVRIEEQLEQHHVGEIIRRSFTRIYRTDDMELPVEEFTHGLERNFLVFDEWQNLVGILNEENIIRAVRRKDFGSPVSGYMLAPRESIGIHDSLRDALNALQQNSCGILPVYENGEIAGVIDLNMISNFLQMKETIKERKEGSRKAA